MFMKKFLALQGYLAPLAGGNGADISHLEEDFDESVLDKEDTSELDGSKFEGDDDDKPNEDPDDAAKRRAKAKEKAKEPEKAPEKKPEKADAEEEEEEGDPAAKTLKDGNALAKKDGEEPPAKKGAIPLDRHEAILNKLRAERDEAVRALQNAQGGQQIVKTNNQLAGLETEVATLQDKYDAALIDGERETAKTIGRELRAKERELGDKKTEIAVAIARAEAIETTRFDVARERIEAAYTVIQPGHEDYDQKVMDEVLELMSMYQMKGYTATDAMQKAVRKELGAEGSAQAAAATVKPRVNAEDVEVDDAALKAKRKENAVDKALKTKQPPSTEKVGLDHDKLGRKTAKDVATMTDEEFDKLTDEELAKLGGDHRLVEEDQD